MGRRSFLPVIVEPATIDMIVEPGMLLFRCRGWSFSLKSSCSSKGFDYGMPCRRCGPTSSFDFPISNFVCTIFQMAEHIEDLQQRYAELTKRIGLVRSYL